MRRDNEVTMSGQSLVEFALVMPLLIFMLLGFAELAFLVATQAGFQRSADALVEWAASEMSEHPSGESWQSGWNQVVREESERSGCGGSSPTLSYPDGTHTYGDRVVLRWQCHYTPRLSAGWDGLPVSVESIAVVPGAAPPPTPSPSASASPS